MVAESSVRNLVVVLRAEVGGRREQVMVPQTHPPAEEAEVDFGEFQAVIAGVLMKLLMFCLRLSHSGKAMHVAYANQSQESFLDAHVRAFQALGGVPVAMIRYDNLTPPVIRVALGRERLENPRFMALRSHYGYDSFFCIPGLDGAHEKGGVEGEIGRFGRRHLTPVPHVGSLAALNAALAAAIAVTTPAGSGPGQRQSVPPPNGRRRYCERYPSRCSTCLRRCRAGSIRRPGSVSDSPTTRSRPATRAAGWRSGWARARSKSLMPARSWPRTRSLHKGSEDLVLDHYLEVLSRKPGALAGPTALVTARAGGGCQDFCVNGLLILV